MTVPIGYFRNYDSNEITFSQKRFLVSNDNSSDIQNFRFHFFGKIILSYNGPIMSKPFEDNSLIYLQKQFVIIATWTHSLNSHNFVT